MKKIGCFLILLHFFYFTVSTAQQQKDYRIITVAFYNLENLFHPENDPVTFDDDRTPDGKDHWTETEYSRKIENMAKVLSEIGRDLSGTSPAIIGLCEIENRNVLEDLITTRYLLPDNYGIIHFDSPDRRGIDVALLYKKHLFVPTASRSIPLLLYSDNDKTKRIHTRDQLVVSGMLDGEKLHLIVNHWPSRSGGEARSRPKRLKAAKLNKRIIDSLWSIDPYAKVISMGDFNDDPTDRSIKKILKTNLSNKEVHLKTLYNPMEALFRKGMGTLAWRDGWNLFDQIIISSEFLRDDYSSYRYYKAGIYNKSYLTNSTGRFKGYPFRSFSDEGFTGGYSDHYPIFIYLIKEISSEEKVMSKN
jgi:endonuclease/exonuclease/phosphatase family metal-dependent hydrolase